MDLDKLLKVLNERHSVNEMPFDRGVEQADAEIAEDDPEKKAALKAKHKAEREKHKEKGDGTTSAGYAKRRGGHEAGHSGLEPTRPRSQNSSTEYEGPSLAEQSEFIKTFLEGHKEELEKRRIRRTAQQVGSKKHAIWSDEERTKDPKGKFTVSYLHGDRARTGRHQGGNSGRDDNLRLRPEDPLLTKRRNRQARWRKEDSSTQYEGPSLAEELTPEQKNRRREQKKGSKKMTRKYDIDRTKREKEGEEHLGDRRQTGHHLKGRNPTAIDNLDPLVDKRHDRYHTAIKKEIQRDTDAIKARSQNSSTEYEGPFLDETTKERIAKVAKRMIAKSKSDAEEEKKVHGTTEYGEGYAAGEHVSKKTDIERRAKKLIGRLKARQDKTQNSSTEYEGPSLAEQVDFIKTFLEGESTGGSPFATGYRVGRHISKLKGNVHKHEGGAYEEFPSEDTDKAKKHLAKKKKQAQRITTKVAIRARKRAGGGKKGERDLERSLTSSSRGYRLGRDKDKYDSYYGDAYRDRGGKGRWHDETGEKD